MYPWSDYLGTYGPGVVVERPWWRVVRSEAGFSHLQRCDGIDRDRFADMDAYDTAHPLPVPKPLVGHVWAYKDGDQIAVTRVESGLAYFGPSRENVFLQYPPSNAVLVYGPSAPWAPVGWKS